MNLSTFLPIKLNPKSTTDKSEKRILKCQFVKILQCKIHARTSIPAVKSKDESLVSLDDKKTSLINFVF